MATVKVYSAQGEKVLSCFDTLDNVPFLTGYEDGTEGLPDFQIEDEQIE